MSKANSYRDLHLLFNQLPRQTFPYKKDKINGVYVFFEKGEQYKGLDRVVWVGTHFNKNRLFYRIDDHYGYNQRLSMLRKHIGRCLLIKQGKDEYLPTWNLGIMNKEVRKNNYPQIDWVLESELEEQISEHLQQHFSFAIISGIEKYEQRKRWASGIIATLAQSKDRCSSEGWLGNLHNHPKIQEGKLWNFQYHQSQPLSQDELIGLNDTVANIMSLAHTNGQ